MNDALADLIAEHKIIARVLRALEQWARTVALRALDDRAELTAFTEFFCRFADDHHHDKEERILFAAMIEHGVPREEGPLAMMLREHQQSRAATRLLLELASQDHPWTDADREVLGASSAGYSNLLRVHMGKEDEFLYPMVTRRLSPVLKHVAREFARFRALETGEDEYRRLLVLGESLIRRHEWGPAPLQRSSAR